MAQKVSKAAATQDHAFVGPQPSTGLDRLARYRLNTLAGLGMVDEGNPG
ncbi:hypothetical protein [Nocardia sp. SYP-A9097]|nr:hypothetical protein [Nocardia sp. SYP-A9097]